MSHSFSNHVNKKIVKKIDVIVGYIRNNGQRSLG